MPNLIQGPSSSAASYIINLEPNVRVEALLTAGTVIGGNIYAGLPDGMGVIDNGTTFTVLQTHEISASNGAVRAHGSTGAFVDEIVIDKATHTVLSVTDLGQRIFQDNDGDGVYTQATTQISRLCSANLADVSAFYNAATGLGTQTRIFLSGEENGVNGRAFGFIATGADKGNVYELPGLGNLSYENAVANAWSGDKTVVMLDNDTGPAGQVYMYVGTKTNTGNDIHKAGLVGGKLYGVIANGIGAANNTSAINGHEAAATSPPTSGTFTVAEIANAATLTGAQIDAAANIAGISGFFRPEDGAWDPTNHNKYYFVTTADQTHPTRIWSLTYADVTTPELGGTFKMEFQGIPGVHVMFDNLTVDATNGHVLLNEDPGNYKGPASIWDFNPATGAIVRVARLDPALFGDGDGVTNSVLPVAPHTNDKETSGIIDVTCILGDSDTRAYLVDVQDHYKTNVPATFEGGQLNVLYIDDVKNGTRASEVLNGSGLADTINGGRGDDTINGGSGNDMLSGSFGNDVLNGGSGNDTLLGGAGSNRLNGDAGNDQLTGGNDRDTIMGGDGNDDIRAIGGDDAIDGGAGNDSINGGAGNDMMLGGAGNDTLLGGNGDDVLVGGAGVDLLNGGAGMDIFRFASLVDAGDTLQGFRSADDQIEVSAAGFGGGLVVGQAVSLVQGLVATHAAGEFMFDRASGVLGWDADGTGVGAAVVVAYLTSTTPLTVADLTIIA